MGTPTAIVSMETNLVMYSMKRTLGLELFPKLRPLQETLCNIRSSVFRVRASCMVAAPKKVYKRDVQIRATKYIDGFKDINYPERSRKLKLPTLMYRRA